MPNEKDLSLEAAFAHENANFREAIECVVKAEPERLASLLKDTPNLISDRSRSEHQCQLLHYVSSNAVEGQLSPETIYQKIQAADLENATSLRSRAIRVVRVLLDHGAEVDALCEAYGGGPNQTALNLLVSSAHPANANVQCDLVQLLCDAGANPDGRDGSGAPIATALLFGYQKTVERIIQCGASTDSLIFSAVAGDLDGVRRHSQDDRTVNQSRDAQHFPAASDRQTAAELALVFASMCGRHAVIELLLQSGVDVNADPPGSHITGSAMHTANNLETVKLLLEHGADHTQRDKQYETTPLEWARVLGRREIMEFLRDDLPLPFGDAVSFGCLDRVRELLQSDGGLVNRQYGPGYLPLVEAAVFGQFEVVELLLQFGADPKKQDAEGNTALDAANREGHAAIVKMLI